MQEKAKRYDMIKIITAMLVVISHATSMYTGEGVVLPTNSSQGLAYICESPTHRIDFLRGGCGGDRGDVPCRFT